MKNIVLIILMIFTAEFSNSQNLQATETKALLNISVTDFNDKPRVGETVMFVSQKTKKEYSVVTKAGGKCQLLLPKGDTYEVKYRDLSEHVKYSQIEVPNQPGRFSFDVKMKFEPSRMITLDNVLFETGKATLKPSSFKELNELVDVMKNKKGMEIEIAGHTDNVGNSESNMKLSLERANAVRNYLIKHGIAANRVKAKGYGDTQPVAPNETAEGRKKNRRTEVRILKEYN